MSLSRGWLTPRVISDKIHRLFVTLFSFRSDRFVHLLSLLPILFLLLYSPVSKDLVYTGICEVGTQKLSEEEQLYAKLNLFLQIIASVSY